MKCRVPWNLVLFSVTPPRENIKEKGCFIKAKLIFFLVFRYLCPGQICFLFHLFKEVLNKAVFKTVFQKQQPQNKHIL